MSLLLVTPSLPGSSAELAYALLSSAGVLTITLNRVDKKNAITAAMYASMADALAQAQADPAVRAVVFQGHETIFSAGNDIGDFLSQAPDEVFLNEPFKTRTG